MKWKSDWWGVTVIAENDDDNSILWKLIERLPVDSFETYEGGKAEHESDESGKYVQLVMAR